VKEETLINRTEIVKIFQQLRSSLFEDTPFSIEEDALLQLRRGLSRGKKRPFLGQEGHILERCL